MAAGATGATGADGTNGTYIFLVGDVPTIADTPGVDEGDIAIDIPNGDYYRFVSGAWVEAYFK